VVNWPQAPSAIARKKWLLFYAGEKQQLEEVIKMSFKQNPNHEMLLPMYKPWIFKMRLGKVLNKKVELSRKLRQD
jgi:hypothetical protein